VVLEVAATLTAEPFIPRFQLPLADLSKNNRADCGLGFDVRKSYRLFNSSVKWVGERICQAGKPDLQRPA
jgi:hypothetical protein